MSGRVLRRDGLSRVSLERRRVCGWLLLPAAQWLVVGRADAAMVASARLWPAQEYTRLILETPAPMAHQLLAMKNPERLVLDLKSEVNPQLFALRPVGEYGHRVVLDLYPLIPLDPLMALLEIERNEGPHEPASAEPPIANA